MLAGCPAPGLTENPLDTPQDGPPVVSVCYPPLVTDLARETAPVALKACAAAGVEDATLQAWKRTHILNDCPLLKKSRIAYRCLPAAADAEHEAEATGDAGAPADDDGPAGTGETEPPAGDDAAGD